MPLYVAITAAAPSSAICYDYSKCWQFVTRRSLDCRHLSGLRRVYKPSCISPQWSKSILKEYFTGHNGRISPCIFTVMGMSAHYNIKYVRREDHTSAPLEMGFAYQAHPYHLNSLFLVWFDSYQLKRSKACLQKLGQFWLIFINIVVVLVTLVTLFTLVTLLVHIGPSAA